MMAGVENTMLVDENGGCGSSVPKVQPAPITEASDTEASASSQPKDGLGIGIGDWLVSVTSNSEDNIETERSRSSPLIQKPSELLRKNDEYNKAFEPQVVALGPFHHGQPRLKAMEDHKKACTKQFIEDSSHTILEFYNKVSAVAGAARKCYADSFGKIDDKNFTDMMFFDGCFLLHFIDAYVNRWFVTTSEHLETNIVRDMFLLDNQIPFMVLDALMSLKKVKIFKFVEMIADVELDLDAAWSEQPFHLLDLLRTTLLGPPEQGPYPQQIPTFPRSARELTEVGITFTTSRTNGLRDVRFSAGFINSQLSLPKLTIEDITSSRFLNLIALELCPDGPRSNYGIISYVWFLDCLIDGEEDVKELRSKGVIINSLGSDVKLAELVNELATDLTGFPEEYYTVISGINDHYNNKARVSIVRMLHTHFSSPWTTISFIAAVCLLLLTFIQTIFTVFPRK